MKTKEEIELEIRTLELGINEVKKTKRSTNNNEVITMCNGMIKDMRSKIDVLRWVIE